MADEVCVFGENALRARDKEVFRCEWEWGQGDDGEPVCAGCAGCGDETMR